MSPVEIHGSIATFRDAGGQQVRLSIGPERWDADAHGGVRAMLEYTVLQLGDGDARIAFGAVDAARLPGRRVGARPADDLRRRLPHGRTDGSGPPRSQRTASARRSRCSGSARASTSSG